MIPGRVNLIFPAFNRLEFTRAAWEALLRNTNWHSVGELNVYDDGSTDGTAEYLEAAVANFQPLSATQIFYHRTRFGSPMGVTLDWIRKNRRDILAKLDNDTVYPPKWLDIGLDVLDRTAVDMLGLECMREPAEWLPEAGAYLMQAKPGECGRSIPFGYLPAKFVSGLGLYRKSAFDRHGLPENGGYFGLEEWQVAHRIRAGWILPSLPTFLLDRLPVEPWRSLSARYVREGWQREWSGAGELRYKPERSAMWEWWLNKPKGKR